MNEERLLKWLDLVLKLLIPVVLAVFTYYQTQISSSQLEHQRHADDERRDFERDAGYVKMLASSNPDEKKLGLEIIRVLAGESRFSKDLIPVLTVYAGGSPTDPLTQLAGSILVKAGVRDQKIGAEIETARSGAPTQVFIQIAKEEQRDDARLLQTQLTKSGFTTPGIQLVAKPLSTTHNYIRFFSAPGAHQAASIQSVMEKLGYQLSPPAGIQDFSAYTQTPLSSLEIWIGSSQGNLNGPSNQ